MAGGPHGAGREGGPEDEVFDLSWQGLFKVVG